MPERHEIRLSSVYSIKLILGVRSNSVILPVFALLFASAVGFRRFHDLITRLQIDREACVKLELFVRSLECQSRSVFVLHEFASLSQSVFYERSHETLFYY